MPFDLLLLPLLGGYIFVSNFNGIKYEAKRLNGQRLLLLSALAGTALLTTAYLLIKALIALAPEAREHWKSIFPYNNLGATTGSLLLGATGWIPLNFIWKKESTRVKAIDGWNDYLEALLDQSIRETKQILVSLKNGKAYIGFTVASFNPEYDRKYILLLPSISGYRKNETHELVLTTDYTSVYLKIIEEGPEANQKQLDDFRIVIPASEVISAHIFNEDAYRMFNPIVKST